MCVWSLMSRYRVIVNARSSLRRSCKERLRPIKDCVSRSSHRLQLSRATGPTTRPTPPAVPPSSPLPRPNACSSSRTLALCGQHFPRGRGGRRVPPAGARAGAEFDRRHGILPCQRRVEELLEEPCKLVSPPVGRLVSRERAGRGKIVPSTSA